MNTSGLFLAGAPALITLICTKLYCLQLLPTFIIQASLLVTLNLCSLQGSGSITNEIGSQSAQSIPFQDYHGANIPVSQRIQSTLDPTTKIVKHLHSPSFLQICPGQQQTQCQFPRERAQVSSKMPKPGSPALAKGSSHSEDTTQDTLSTRTSTSCLWAASRDTGLGESQSENMDGIRSNSPISRQGPKMFPEVSSELANH